MERNSLPKQHPVVVSTSSIALQKAILSEYVPFLSRVLVEQGIIQTPLRAVVRKGKEHFVCDNRLEQRIEAIRHKQKNAVQREALLSLRKHYDMDTVKDLSGFDRRLVCVPKFCPRECPGRQTCRYQRYLEESKKQDVLPFAVPDPISEAEKETYESLEDYIQSIIVPDMQKKLRQGFGRAIRTETDTCVVSILDIRAVKGGKYHEDVMCALPPCQMAEELREVQDFIRSRKGVEYYL